MTGILTNYPDNAFALENLTVTAYLLDRSTNFHCYISKNQKEGLTPSKSEAKYTPAYAKSQANS
jgi:hypothetical protein